MFYINGLEYLGRDVKIKGKAMKGVEAKRFVTLKKTDRKPSADEVKKLAQEYRSKGNAKLAKVWVMQMNGNKWKKVIDTINIKK
ncbi:MAG: hypothetical protein HY555_05095 [Euryarchaeota archaeon]|nr:hypothetical protein [Euryarchaeota archaeon]